MCLLLYTQDKNYTWQGELSCNVKMTVRICTGIMYEYSMTLECQYSEYEQWKNKEVEVEPMEINGTLSSWGTGSICNEV